ncbi:MAG: PDZ domain-containing protein [Verrucomicrobiota bacterium]
MKTTPIITTAMAAFMISPAFAIDAPVDDARPPAVADSAVNDAPKPDNAAEKNVAEKKENIAYLGVLVAPVPDMLAGHLGLKDSEGVAVQMVAPDGPAAKAGIAVNDIITRVGDKPVGSHEELSQLVTGRKPGDSLHLEMIHKGKKSGLDVKLDTRPEGIDNLQPNPLIEGLPLDGVPKEMADRIRGAIRGNLGGIQLQFGDLNPDAIAPKNIEEMRKQMRKMRELKGFGAMPDFQSSSRTRMMDGEGSVEMKSTNGGKEVTLSDKNGKVTWTGPWDTEQDKAAAPENVRERIKRLNMDGAGAVGGMVEVTPDLLNPNQNGDKKPAGDGDGDGPQ